MLKLKEFTITGLSALSLSIKGGECVGLSGVSGCGKTRLLRAIADLDEHAGVLMLDDAHWDEIKAHHWRRKVALLPAESLWWFDSIGEHFYSLTTDTLSQLGFTRQTLDWESSRCSSGEKQRLSILRLTQNKPRVLLLDEPTANLDEANSHLVETFIKNYIKSNNAIVIRVSHNTEQLRRVSSRQYLLENSALVEVGSEGVVYE